jgi:hypothetical protein
VKTVKAGERVNGWKRVSDFPTPEYQKAMDELAVAGIPHWAEMCPPSTDLIICPGEGVYVLVSESDGEETWVVGIYRGQWEDGIDDDYPEFLFGETDALPGLVRTLFRDLSH